MRRRPPISTLFPYTTLFRSPEEQDRLCGSHILSFFQKQPSIDGIGNRNGIRDDHNLLAWDTKVHDVGQLDRKSTRLNSSHSSISYAVFCLKKQREIRRARSD